MPVVLLTWLASGLLSCATPTLEPADTPTAPDTWTAAGATLDQVEDNWISTFDDPALARLVHQALQHNFDLTAAAQRVRSAYALAALAGADLQPRITLDAKAGRARAMADGGAGNSFDLTGQVSWEADLWGRLTNRETAAYADAEAARADYRSARLLIASQVARTWFTAIESHLQFRLSQNTVANFADTLEIIESRYRRGLNTALEVRLARENLASAESIQATRAREQELARRQLQVLLGDYPDNQLVPPDRLPILRHPLPAGLPAQLLDRRPDLMALRLRMAAADARLLDALRNRLPNIVLTGSGGRASDQLHDLLEGDRLLWSLFGTLTQVLWDGGRLDAERARAQAELGEIQSNYAQTLLNAFLEVETGLSAELYYKVQEQALAIASREAAEARALALQRYQKGLTDIVTLLEAQRRAFNAESSRLLTARQRLDNRVGLHLALGGDLHQPD